MIADLFIKRPKFAIVIAILMMLAGGICLNQLPIAEYPEIAPTSINVQATYTGASAQVVMETLASPIEEELNGLENLLYFSSKSDNTGGYSPTLTFKSGTNSDINMVNVQNALKRVEYKLPKEVTDQGIKIRKRSSDILGFFAFRSTSMSSLELNNFVKTRVKDEVARVPGISAVNLMPEKNYGMRIWLDALRMSALNITPDDVSNAIKAQNVQAAAGSIGSEMTSEINNIINGVINYTQTLIDLDARGDSGARSEPLYQSLLKEEKKIVDLSAAMQRLGQGPSSRQGSSLSSLFKTLSLILDKPLRAESIVLVVPAECQGEVSVPGGDLWLVLLTLVQQGRRALKRVLPGRQQEKSLRIDCAPDETKGGRVTLTLVNSAACWDEESGTAAPAWPTQPFCVELLRLHGACLTTVATAEGTRLQLELPVRGGAA